MTNETKIVSEYRKAQRFFEKFNMPLLDIGDFVLSQFTRPKNGWTLAMDRTNWKFGKTHINILTVGVVIKGIALPIAWKVLPQTTKRGNSNTAQRIAIIENILKLMPATSIYALTMDREFIGKSWLKWLDDQGVDFIVRIKKNHKINNVSAEMFRQKRNSKTPTRVGLWGLKFYFGAKAINIGRDSHLYVISNKFTAKDALKIYKQRWSIELLFSHLKKRGFNLEDTHMTDAVKLERLFGVVTLSFLALRQIRMMEA
jgi:transposase